MTAKNAMKAYTLVPDTFGYVERADIRAADLTQEDRYILRLMCLDWLRRRAEEKGIAEWVGVVVAEGETASGGYEMTMQAATLIIDSGNKQ